MPAVVAGVATALMWGWILNPTLRPPERASVGLGVDGPAWLTDPIGRCRLILMGLWNVGVNVVVYSAALTRCRAN